MNTHDLDRAAKLLATWKQNLGASRSGGTQTESDAIQEIVVNLAYAGLRIERQKLNDLAESAKSLRLTEVVPESTRATIRETTETIRPIG